MPRFSKRGLVTAFAGLDPVNAVAAKLLRIVNWVLKNNKEYQTQIN